MALATLCSKLRQSPAGTGLSFTAFIVDHGLRPGSDDEALTVAMHLKQIGTSRYAVYIWSVVLIRSRYALEDHHP
jgi:tRNA(Ile)-lysidine synthase TilS/MesJ